MRGVLFKRTVFLLLVLMAILIAGCGEEENQTEMPTEGVTLWIVMEKNAASGMREQAESVARAFEADHPGVKVNLETLPESGQERENRLEQLRTQIMNGSGPDGFLLPTTLWEWPATTPLQIAWDGDRAVFTSATPQENPESLFINLDMAMYSGLFADLSPYYDADTELHTEALQQTVMEAGVVGGARYVLPLRYEIPVIYADAEQLAAQGLDTERMGKSLYAYWDVVLGTGQLPWMKGALYQWGARHMQVLPVIYDYEGEQVILQKEALRTFLERYQQMRAAVGNHPLRDQTDFSVYWLTKAFLDEDVPLEPGNLDRAYTTAAIGASAEKPVVMLPLRSVEGETVARITYFAAAGAGTEHLELTYDFLREFLTEEAQWQQLRNSRPLSGERLLAADGWPVRYNGSVEPLWNYVKQIKELEDKRSEALGSTNPGHKRLLKLELTDRDVPILSVPIDRAYFDNDGLQALLDSALQKLNDPERNRIPSDVDLDQLAEDILAELEQYLAEG